MSEAATVIASPPLELIYDDGEPLESDWHGTEIGLFIEVLQQAMSERGTTDYFAGGNMFIYYSREQAHAIATEPLKKTRHFRGPGPWCRVILSRFYKYINISKLLE